VQSLKVRQVNSYKLLAISCKGGVKVVAERSEYKGKPMLVLKSGDEDKFPFSFGISKARKILEHLEDIKKFVEEEGGK
jgi:hypothetical protein